MSGATPYSLLSVALVAARFVPVGPTARGVTNNQQQAISWSTARASGGLIAETCDKAHTDFHIQFDDPRAWQRYYYYYCTTIEKKRLLRTYYYYYYCISLVR